MPSAVAITEPVLLIRISRLYRDSFTADELYDATRSSWRLSTRRDGARYVFAVYRGEVKEVYEIDEWHRGGTTPCSSGVHKNPPEDLAIDIGRHASRWEFTGKKSQELVRSKYVGKSVAAYFSPGSRHPVQYVNV